ncbi:MAG: hypothetical protein L7F78_02575 [Syntrophales bacterium LBB04]|nr:hypothetical protein [Syntrophales bacterium LBB04]
MDQIKQIRVRSGKSGSIALIVIGSLFFVFGTFLTNIGLADSSEPDLQTAIWLFRFVWWVICLAMITYGLLMLIRKKTPTVLEMELEDKGTEGDFEVRLRKLQSLRNENLISPQEYDKKRAEIMREKW